jgi:hypothetical protein
LVALNRDAGNDGIRRTHDTNGTQFSKMIPQGSFRSKLQTLLHVGLRLAAPACLLCGERTSTDLCPACFRDLPVARRLECNKVTDGLQRLFSPFKSAFSLY